MFLTHKPAEHEIDSFILTQQQKPFSYSPQGLTQITPTSGYNVDHNRVRLGSGVQCFTAAVAAIRQWKMFDIDWLYLAPDDAPIEVGSNVAVIARHLGFWSMNAARIVYVVDEKSLLERFGFAYGTLAGHAERGEERFLVEWNRDDDSVWYDLLAVSKPGLMAMLAYPYSRALQRRFARDSKRAMSKAVAGAGI